MDEIQYEEVMNRIENEITEVGGYNRYVELTYGNSGKAVDLSIFLNRTIKENISNNCSLQCEQSDIDRLTDNLYPIISTNDAETIIESRDNNITIDRTELDSYPQYIDIKSDLISTPNECMQCFKEYSMNNNLKDSRTCENTFGLSNLPEGDYSFNCMSGYGKKPDLSTINCPDQTDCTNDLCCDVKDMEYYVKTITPIVALFFIIIFILSLTGYFLKNRSKNELIVI